MGQKVHPLGFRVGITKKHQSQWFARFHKHKYSQSVLEDRMIRQTLTTLFPQLINPSLKKVQKRAEDRELKANITQIKIERALIPYEISIQIHAENCELIKSALDNLTVQPDLVCKLEKARRYLFSLNDKLSQMSIIKETFKADQAQSNLSKTAPVMALSSGKSNSEEKQALGSAATGKVENKSPNKTSEKNQSKSSVFSKAKQAFGVRNGAKLTKQEFRKQRILKKRFLKRQSIKNRYRQLIVKNLLLKKKANKIVQKLSLKNKKLNSKTNKFTKKSPKLKKNFLKVRNQNKLSPIPFGEKARSEQVYFSGKIKNAGQQSRNDFAAGGSAPGLRNQAQTGSRLASQKNQTKNLLASRIKKKFVSLFIKKRNKNFLLDLKTSLKYWYENKKYQRFSTINSLAERPVSKDKLLLGAPIGYSKKWSLNRLETLKKEPLTKLNRLVSILEEKALIKMESLRKEFIAFGFVSKTQSFGYYQIINFLKHLKELVNKLKRERFYSRDSIGNKIASAPFAPKEERGSKPQQILNKLSYTSLTAPGENISGLQGLNLSSLVGEKSSAPKSLAETVLRSKLGNIAVECRKIKFIEYLKQIIKKHRQENIFFYLSTVSEANKNLKKLKQFTKQNSNFLFGTKLRKNQISRVLVKSGEKSDLEKNLQDIFLEQIEKQRTMHQENKQLIPKISIQFFSVQPSLVSIKASTVADLVVDDLEKRKAFRQVIKKAKEELMKKTGVKGVKIQLSGRLNGAEIARTEWVRAGRIPLQTLRANLDYAYRTANTIYGIIGVKVWVFKGLKTI